jgi:hypothetical protein
MTYIVHQIMSDGQIKKDVAVMGRKLKVCAESWSETIWETNARWEYNIKMHLAVVCEWLWAGFN